jgi:hypothetical protein
MSAPRLARVLLGLPPQVGDVHVAVRVRPDHHDAEAGHHRARRVGAVRALRDEAHPPVALAARLVVALDDEQPGVLALRARVRLQRHAGEAGDLGQVVLELPEQLRVPLGLLAGANGCSCPNSGHVTGSISAVALSFIVHEPSGIMLCTSGDVAPLELAHVAQQLGLAVVAVEHLVRQEGARPREPLVVARVALGDERLERRVHRPAPR